MKITRQNLVLLIGIWLALLGPVQAQDDWPPSGVQVSTDQVTDGYILFSPMSSPATYLIDNAGRVINQWTSEYNPLAVYLLENGHVLMSVVVPSGRFGGGITGRIEEYDWDGNLVWTFDYRSDTYYLHHDIQPMPNGHVLVTGWELVTAEEALALGLLPEMLPEIPSESSDGRIHDDSLWLDRILEINPETDSIVWEWRVSDHLIQDTNPDLPNYGSIAEFPRRINLNHANPNLPNDRTHFNSIDYNPDLDQILVSALSYGEIWVIDHALSTAEAAGPDGDLLYRWGNPAVYRRGTRDERQLFRQHDAHWLPNGNIMIFNNGHPRRRPYSTVFEIVPPLLDDGTYALEADAPYGPPEPVWFYESVPAEDFYARNTSGAQRLPNDHLFITDGPGGRFFEVTADGEVIWEYLSPIFLTPHPETRGPVFRARRYLPDYPAFAGRDLIPGDVLEMQILNENPGPADQ